MDVYDIVVEEAGDHTIKALLRNLPKENERLRAAVKWAISSIDTTVVGNPTVRSLWQNELRLRADMQED